MIINMKKQKEDDKYVWYTFETDREKSFYINEKNRRISTYEKIGGFYKYNKIDPVTEESLELIKDQTNPIFWDPNHPEYRQFCSVIYKCMQRMSQYRKSNDFPQETCWASSFPNYLR